MKPKATFKIVIDVAMTVLFLLQMGYHMVDNRTHEWLGITLCTLFLLHHALNAGWHRNLFKGKYTAQRVLLTATIEQGDMELLKNISPIQDYGEFSAFPVFSQK